MRGEKMLWIIGIAAVILIIVFIFFISSDKSQADKKRQLRTVKNTVREHEQESDERYRSITKTVNADKSEEDD
jgi:cell division protein FtsL